MDRLLDYQKIIIQSTYERNGSEFAAPEGASLRAVLRQVRGECEAACRVFDGVSRRHGRTAPSASARTKRSKPIFVRAVCVRANSVVRLAAHRAASCVCCWCTAWRGLFAAAYVELAARANAAHAVATVAWQWLLSDARGRTAHRSTGDMSAFVEADQALLDSLLTMLDREAEGDESEGAVGRTNRAPKFACGRRPQRPLTRSDCTCTEDTPAKLPSESRKHLFQERAFDQTDYCAVCEKFICAGEERRVPCAACSVHSCRSLVANSWCAMSAMLFHCTHWLRCRCQATVH